MTLRFPFISTEKSLQIKFDIYRCEHQKKNAIFRLGFKPTFSSDVHFAENRNSVAKKVMSYLLTDKLIDYGRLDKN